MSSAETTAAAIAAATKRDRTLIAAFRGQEMTEGGDQVAALVDVAKLLSGSHIAFALIGGLAVGIHSGSPRATMDIDIAVPTSFDTAELVSMMTRGGFELRGKHPHSLNFRHRSGEPVQIAMDPQFDAMIERATPIEIHGVGIPVVTKEDLISMKERAAGDPSRRRSKALRDAADVELLRGDVAPDDEGW